MSDKPTSNSGKGGKKKNGTGNVAGENKPPARSPNRRQTRTNQTNNAEPRGRFDAIAVFTGLLVVAGVITFSVMVVPQRANVRFSSVSGNILTPNQQLEIKTVFHNYGQMDAHITGMCFQFVNVDQKWPDKPDFGGPGCAPYRAVIPGGQDHVFWGPIGHSPNGAPVSMPPWVTDEIKQGTRPVTIYGRMEYFDAYSPILNPFNIFGTKGLNYCSTFVAANNTWSECGDRPNYVSD